MLLELSASLSPKAGIISLNSCQTVIPNKCTWRKEAVLHYGVATIMHTTLHWFKKVALPGYFLTDSLPEVENVYSHIEYIVFGDFTEKAHSLSYNHLSGQIEGFVGGIITLKSEYMGLQIGYNYNAKASMTVDMENRITYTTYQ